LSAGSISKGLGYVAPAIVMAPLFRIALTVVSAADMPVKALAYTWTGPYFIPCALFLQQSERLVVSSSVVQIDVWYQITECLSDVDIAQAMELLSSDERARFDRFVFRCDRRDFAAAHALLRCALATRTGLPPSSWIFLNDCRGKPFLAPGQPECEFNIAHTTGLVACALAKTGNVGIDVESVDRVANSEEIARKYFSEREVLALQECKGVEHQTRFIELWTLKEAYLKAIGTGLSDRLNDFSFELIGSSGLRFNSLSGTGHTNWHFALFAPSEGHRMAVAICGEHKVTYRVMTWTSAPQVAPTTAFRTSSGV
jgi:4'-phosphopantetheinyl transferase